MVNHFDVSLIFVLRMAPEVLQPGGGYDFK